MKSNFTRIILLLLFAAITLVPARAQTFTGSGGAIPDNGQVIDFTISVSGLPLTIDTSSFGLESVCINILHTWDSDLDINLVAPDGTTLTLASGVGNDGDNFLGTCFRSDATNGILQGSPPFTGDFRPLGSLGMVNNGQNPNGNWILRIRDTYPADAGTLLGWQVQFGNNPATIFKIDSTNLPIVIIETNGQIIPDEPKVTAWMGIIDNGPGNMNHPDDSTNNYDGYIGIELRGHSSAGFPQKQFGIETRDSTGNNLDVSILGMPAENDWVLYAPYNDKSLMRNALTYALVNDMGRYASRARYCELILNGEYKGVYTFFEKVKRDQNRVDIAKLAPDDTAGANVTGGYICSSDWISNGGWTSNYPPDPNNPINNTVFYQYIYPQDTLMHPSQQLYIQQYVDSFETALLSSNFDDPLSGWRQYADENSFIDFFLINEISKNVDGYRLSTFFYKDKITNSGGKINMGPVWDFNLAWHNANYCNNQSTTGWAYLFTNYCDWDFPFWWRRLSQDSLFRMNVRCRWNDLRTTTFDTLHIFSYIDSIATLLNDAKQRHYYVYPILGIYTWPNPSPIPTTYAGEINSMKSWIRSRIQYMDNNLPGTCITTAMNTSPEIIRCSVVPNPANGKITVTHGLSGKIIINIYNLTGEKVMETTAFNEQQRILDIIHLPAGFYMLRIYDDHYQSAATTFMKQ